MRVVGDVELMQQGLGDEIGEEDADYARDQSQHGELDGEDAGDAPAGRAERFEHDHLAKTAVLCSRDGGREDNDAGEDGEGGEELDDIGDLQHHGMHGFNGLRHVNDGDGGVPLIESALELAYLGRIDVNASVPDDGKSVERRTRQDVVGAREYMLSVCAGERDDGRVNVRVLGREGDGGTDGDAEAFG